MDTKNLKVFVGYDPRFPASYAVTVRSIRKHSPNVPIVPIVLSHLQGEGLYTRHTVRNAAGDLHDTISNAPMSTEFAISRFLVPCLSGFEGYSIFVDGDFLFRDDITRLAAFANTYDAISVVKHQYADANATKMGGQAQTNYERKNWSSLMLFNCSHRCTRELTPEFVNSVPGRVLHGLRYVPDDQIGLIPEAWNWLEGHSSCDIDPSAVHFTRGTPEMGMQPTAYADEWKTLALEIA